MLIVGSPQIMQQIQTPLNINFISKNLVPITEVKDLGIYLDSSLSYNKHIQALSSSCVSKLGQINRVKHLFDQKTLSMIKDTLINNGNCTEWGAIWCEIKRVITKLHDREAGVQFVSTSLISHQNCTTRSAISTLLYSF